MKHYTCLILFIIASLQSNAQYITGAVFIKHSPPLKSGKPLTIVETFTDFNIPDEIQKHIVDYDETGMITRRNVYDKTGRLVAHWEFENDTALKKVLYRIAMHYQGREEFTDTSLFSYDQKGLLVREEKRNGRWIRTTNYTNTAYGFPVKTKTFNETGKLVRQEKAVYNLDSNYMILSISDFESNRFYKDTARINYGKPCLMYKEVVMQNERGDNVISSGINKLGNVYKLFMEYEYDERGNWTSQKTFILKDEKNIGESRQLLHRYTRAITYKD